MYDTERQYILPIHQSLSINGESLLCSPNCAKELSPTTGIYRALDLTTQAVTGLLLSNIHHRNTSEMRVLKKKNSKNICTMIHCKFLQEFKSVFKQLSYDTLLGRSVNYNQRSWLLDESQDFQSAVMHSIYFLHKRQTHLTVRLRHCVSHLIQ